MCCVFRGYGWGGDSAPGPEAGGPHQVGGPMRRPAQAERGVLRRGKTWNIVSTQQ